MWPRQPQRRPPHAPSKTSVRGFYSRLNTESSNSFLKAGSIPPSISSPASGQTSKHSGQGAPSSSVLPPALQEAGRGTGTELRPPAQRESQSKPREGEPSCASGDGGQKPGTHTLILNAFSILPCQGARPPQQASLPVQTSAGPTATECPAWAAPSSSSVSVSL